MPRQWLEHLDGLPEKIRQHLVETEATDPAVVAELAASPEELVEFVRMLSPRSDEEEITEWAIRLGAAVDAAGALAGREQLRMALLTPEAMSSELVRMRKVRRKGPAPGDEDSPDAARPPPPSATRWRRTRLGNELKAADTPTARQDANDKEKARWVGELASIIVACKMPAAARAERSMDPSRALARLAKGLRARTIRKRVRAWQKMAAWLATAKGVYYPYEAVDVVDYGNDRSDEPAGPGVFEALKAAIKLIEMSAGCRQMSSCRATPG